MASATLLNPIGPAELSAEQARTARPAALMRVMHVVNGEHYAGAERVQDLLALGLPAEGFEVGFACVKPDRFAALRKSQQTPLYEFRMANRWDLSPARKLARLIRDYDYRLVHTHTPRAAFIGRMAAAMAGVPIVHHLHSPTTVDSTHRLRNWFNAAAERLSLAQVAAVIAVSESLRDYARRMGIDPKRTYVVYNGVPTRGPLAPRSTPADSWTLGCVALFRPRKGLEILLKALARLRSVGRSVRLRAVGSFETPDYELKIHRFVDQLGLGPAVDWRGFSSNVNAELEQMDLFVLPSLFGEGLPMVILEAMAAGTPVIGTRVEGVPEAVRDGLDGLLAAPGDADDLARAIASVIDGETDWQALRASAHARQAQRFSDRSMAAGVADVYRRVLNLDE
ncbi:MAG TPA: glycosyltransferase family 4 protein [Pirellulales bacterium]|nr:glycosyltransferase family 4 protein [Pirellulales bacterium]